MRLPAWRCVGPTGNPKRQSRRRLHRFPSIRCRHCSVVGRKTRRWEASEPRSQRARVMKQFSAQRSPSSPAETSNTAVIIVDPKISPGLQNGAHKLGIRPWPLVGSSASASFNGLLGPSLEDTIPWRFSDWIFNAANPKQSIAAGVPSGNTLMITNLTVAEAVGTILAGLCRQTLGVAKDISDKRQSASKPDGTVSLCGGHHIQYGKPLFMGEPPSGLSPIWDWTSR